MAGWSARALARQTGISASTIVLWITKGLITPEQKGKGRNGHLIGLSGLLELLTIVELRQVGFSLQSIQRAIENLRVISGESRPIARFSLVVRGSDIVWLDADSVSELTFSALQQPGQRLMVFPVVQRQIELAGQLEQAEPVVGSTFDDGQRREPRRRINQRKTAIL